MTNTPVHPAPTTARARARRRFIVVPALVLVVVSTLAPPAAASGSIDWNDRSTTQIELPSGWHLEACEGDAPVLCATDPSGAADGTITLDVQDLPAGADLSRAAVEEEAAAQARVIGEDRKLICGDEYEMTASPVTDVTIDGVPGFRFAVTLRDGDGDVTEHVVLHRAYTSGLRILVSTAFSDPAACPGEDPERDEFSVSARDAIEPHLDELMSTSVLPVHLDTGPACLPGQVPPSRYADTVDSMHRLLIDCTTWFGILNGVSATEFEPDRSMTRAELATVIARLMRATGEPLPVPSRGRFDDVSESVHSDHIEAVAAAGIMKGTTSTTFAPNRPATRAQAASAVVAAYEHHLRRPLFDAQITFDDVSGVHAEAVSRAGTAGLAKGTSSDEFQPSRPIRRDHVAAIVARAVNRLRTTARIALPPR